MKAEKFHIERKILLVFIVFFLYYLIPPLTWDYAFAREYDLFALGIKQTNEFRLPLVETYYTPAVALAPAFLSKILPLININKIMIIIYSLLPLAIIVLLYFFGHIVLKNKSLGIFFSGAYALTGLSKNAVFGGSAWPSLLSLVYSLAFLIFFLSYISDSDLKKLCMASLMLAGAVVSHIDTAVVLVYALISFFVASFLTKKNLKELVTKFLMVSLMAMLIISPFLISSLNNKEKLKTLWTEESWLEQQKGESHVKGLSELFFFNGRIASTLAILGLLFCIFHFVKKRETFSLFLVILAVIMLLQNTWIFVRLSRWILPYYPLNIIMWMDLALILSFLGGYALYTMNEFFKYKSLFQIFVLCLIVFSYVSFETVNAEKIYPDQGGFLKRGLISKGDYVSQGDLIIMSYLRTKNGTLLNNNLLVGSLIPVVSEKETYTHVYEQSYFDPSQQSLFKKRRKNILSFFSSPLDPSSIQLLAENNISYIFLANEQTYNSTPDLYNYNPELIESGVYTIEKRDKGAKLLVHKNSTTVLRHFEAEDYSSASLKYYSPPAMKAKTVIMNNNAKIVIPQKKLKEFINKTVTVYVKYTSFINEPRIIIQQGNQVYTLQSRTNKVLFTEANVSFTIKDNDLEIRTDDTLLFMPLEIDWIEVETKR